MEGKAKGSLLLEEVAAGGRQREGEEEEGHGGEGEKEGAGGSGKQGGVMKACREPQERLQQA